jgi:hypothetical protein
VAFSSGRVRQNGNHSSLRSWPHDWTLAFSIERLIQINPPRVLRI